MSRQIPPERIDSGDLTDDEILYLQDRGLLPEHVDRIEVRYYEGANVAELPEASSAPSEEGEVDANEDEGEAPGVEYALSDAETEDYDEGWTNVARRAELTERGLSVDGKKEQLISRLLRSDAEQLSDDDYAVEEDDEGDEE